MPRDPALAVALVGLSPAVVRSRLAMVNGDEMMYAASLPKIAILLDHALDGPRWPDAGCQN